jgi:hypothetical protein
MQRSNRRHAVAAGGNERRTPSTARRGSAPGRGRAVLQASPHQADGTLQRVPRSRAELESQRLPTSDAYHRRRASPAGLRRQHRPRHPHLVVAPMVSTCPVQRLSTSSGNGKKEPSSWSLIEETWGGKYPCAAASIVRNSASVTTPAGD